MSVPPASSGQTAVFDFDGVLLRGDSFAGYLQWRGRRSYRTALPALPLLPLLPLLRHPRTLPWAARLFSRALTLNLDQARFEAEAAAFCRDWLARPGRVIEPLLARLRAHQAAGDRVIVASGTAQFLLDTFLRELGVAGVAALGSPLQFHRWGLRSPRHNYGATKLISLAEIGVHAPWAVSYSDSHADLPMLAAARQAVLVQPSANHERLLREALRCPVEVVRLSGW